MVQLSEYQRGWAKEKRTLTGKDSVIGIVGGPAWDQNPVYKRNILNSFKAKEWSAIAGLAPDDRQGPASISLAAGSIGVAPAAKIVYVELPNNPPYGRIKGMPSDEWKQIRREFVLDRNATGLETLKRYAEYGGRLDVVSLSMGWQSKESGSCHNDKLVSWFEARGIPVYSVNNVLAIGDNKFYCCRANGFPAAMDDGSFGSDHENRVAIPIDGAYVAVRNASEAVRLGAPFTHVENGKKKWAPPVVAGMFALAREADPAISKAKFEEVIDKTSRQTPNELVDPIKVPDLVGMEREMGVVPQRAAANVRLGGLALNNA
jgi:hypothetical protein